jgi:hypothetical protein
MMFIIGYLTVGICSLLYLDYQHKIIHGIGVVELAVEKTAASSDTEPDLMLYCLAAIVLTLAAPLVLILSTEQASSLSRYLLDKAEEYRNEAKRKDGE